MSATGYQLTKAFYRLVGDREDIQKEVKPHHQSLYTWICELRNRIQIYDPKAEILDLPREYTMKMSFIGSPTTLKNCTADLVKWGVIEIVALGKNDYTGATKVRISCSFMNRYCTATEQQLNSNDTATEPLLNTIKTELTGITELTKDVVVVVKTREGENLPVGPQDTSPPITPVARPPSSPDELSKILSEHETRLQADSEFVRTTARALGIKDAAGEYDTAKIISMVGRFFAEQIIAQNQRARVWGEAKSHCYNWIRIQIEKQPTPNEQRTYQNGNSQQFRGPRAAKTLATTTDDELLDYMQNGEKGG